MLAPETAWRRIAEQLSPLAPEPCSRREALGRILAGDLFVTTAIPAADVSAMDGFAVAGEILPGGRRPIAGTVVAGEAPGAVLTPGTALRIWTGAPLPAGSDRVVPVEKTAEIPGSPPWVTLHEAVPAGAHIRRRGEVLRPGEPLLAAGSRLGPAALSLLASQGIAEVDVVRRPNVAILPTGDEIVPAGRSPGPGQLRDSHTDFLMAAAKRLRLPTSPIGILRDDPGALAAKIAAALDHHDVIVVCGGVSMGGRDHTATAFAGAGAETVFHGVAIQPGKPLLFAVREGRLLFGLPGNPASVMVTFRLFVQPALLRLAGSPGAFWSDARTVELAAPLAVGKPRDRFVPAAWRGRGESGHERVEPLGVLGSHDLATFGAADRLLRVPAGAPALTGGDLVEAIEWE